MAFNGTRHFPKQDVVAFLQSTGMRFGAHINANTSFDQTVYQLQIPTDSAAVIDRSFLILEDWAHAVSFDPDEIDKERGVILEEWRAGPRRRRPDARRAASRPAQGLPLRRAPPDRKAGDHPDVPLRPPEEVLHRLVSARSHGRRSPSATSIRRRSKRSSGRTSARSRPPRRRGRGRSTTCPISQARATPSPPTPRRPRPRSAYPARWPRAIRRPSAPTGSRRSSGCSAACCPLASPRWRRSRTRRFWMPRPTAASSCDRPRRRR